MLKCMLILAFQNQTLHWQEAFGPATWSNWGLVIVGLIAGYLASRTLRAIYIQANAQMKSLRAWIIIYPNKWNPGVFPIPVAGQVPLNVFECNVRNVGNTPAHITKWSAWYQILNKNEYDNLPKEPVLRHVVSVNGRILVPDSIFDQTIPLQPTPILDIADVTKIQNAEKFLFFYGFIEYNDDFGKTHETRVGYVYYFPQGGMVSYEKPYFKPGGPLDYNRAT
jgi:hypothetical protein